MKGLEELETLIVTVGIALFCGVVAWFLCKSVIIGILVFIAAIIILNFIFKNAI